MSARGYWVRKTCIRRASSVLGIGGTLVVLALAGLTGASQPTGSASGLERFRAGDFAGAKLLLAAALKANPNDYAAKKSVSQH